MFFLVAAVRTGLAIFPVKTVRGWLIGLAKRYPLEAGEFSIERTAYMIGLISVKLLRDGPCLTQALAMQFMLERAGLPAVLKMGVMKTAGGRLAAHAWIESEGEVIIGGPVEALLDYTPLTD